MLPSKKRSLIKFSIYFFSIAIVFIIIFYKIDKDIKPVLIAVSNNEVRIKATDTINMAVRQELSKNVKYSDFVVIKTDKNGDISVIELNTTEMNKFGNNVSLEIQEELKTMGARGIDIPLGVITGSSLLSYYGPKIKVDVLPIGYVKYDFVPELQSAGINQTRYCVNIIISTNMQIIIPMGKEIIDVTSKIPIAETLIVGKVPASYFNSQGSQGAGSSFSIPIPKNGEKDE